MYCLPGRREMRERMGFVREPATDFSPAKGVVMKGYRLDLRATPIVAVQHTQRML